MPPHPREGEDQGLARCKFRRSAERRNCCEIPGLCELGRGVPSSDFEIRIFDIRADVQLAAYVATRAFERRRAWRGTFSTSICLCLCVSLLKSIRPLESYCRSLNSRHHASGCRPALATRVATAPLSESVPANRQAEKKEAKRQACLLCVYIQSWTDEDVQNLQIVVNKRSGGRREAVAVDALRNLRRATSCSPIRRTPAARTSYGPHDCRICSTETHKKTNELSRHNDRAVQHTCTAIAGGALERERDTMQA